MKKRPLEERILARIEIDPVTECWNWTGPDSGNGYGSIGVDSRTVRVHRLSYTVFVGPIPESLHVCHHCDNRKCVNPKHLFVGTAKDNADDRDRKQRNLIRPILRGEDSPSAKLTNDQVVFIRNSSTSSAQIAPAFGMSPGQIRAIRRREFYRYVPTPPTSTEGQP